MTNGRLDEAIDLAALPLSGDERSKLAHLALVKKTLEFTDDHSRVAGYLLNNLARGMLSNPSGYEAANEHLQNALKIADAHDDLNLRATLLRSLVENRHFHGVKSDEDAELLESAMESARTANAPGIEADCARGATYLALQRGDGPAAVRFGEQAVGAAERSRQRNTLVQCLASHGAAYEAVANWEGFFSVVNRSLELDPENSAVLAQKIRIEEILGRSADVDRHLAKLSEISNNKHAEHFDQVNFAGVLATTSDRKPEYIARALSLARRQAQRTDVPKRVIAQAYGIIGLLGYATGSSELAQKALEFTENNPETLLGDPVAEFHHGLVLTMLGRIDEGIETIGRLHQQFEPALFPAQSTHFSILLARALASRSTSEDIQQANDLLNTTEDSIRKHQLHGLTIRVMAVRKLLAEITGKTRRADGLTKRELEILSLVATGRNNPEIAEELFISRHTVVSHLSNIFEKIDVENRAQAAAYAVEHSIA